MGERTIILSEEATDVIRNNMILIRNAKKWLADYSWMSYDLSTGKPGATIDKDEQSLASTHQRVAEMVAKMESSWLQCLTMVISFSLFGTVRLHGMSNISLTWFDDPSGYFGGINAHAVVEGLVYEWTVNT